MKELDQLKKLTESMQRIESLNEYGESRILYVFDGVSIEELDTHNDTAMAHFDEKYGFDSSSVFDFPIERGVREFQVNGQIILVSGDPQALAAEVEAQQ